MKQTTNLLAVLSCVICGCSQDDFDASKAGDLRFAHTTISNGKPVQYEWVIPAEDIQSVLKYIVARDTKYDGVLVSGSQTASLSYAGEDVTVAWSRVKMAETVVLLTLRGNRYMLVEPHAGEFYR